MTLLILPDGTAKCVYAETIDLNRLGDIAVTRASHVEPDSQGQWWADLSPVSGPALGPFTRRSDALAAETDWLGRNWLTPSHT
ncbi:hypothetical protein [Humisphaera borealis]|uniref:Uncharacterized protein n=1 Tax=Humisphaera borealis TaxID=2807512 RepID=A0A7M2WT51_9BACT|nr:hypothetical protein [Humisphaera borealis]QOV88444.1 hypothetical protein IPV69_19650 [Humisphaera borealis]